MPRYSVSCTVHEAVLPQQPGGLPVDPLVVMRCFGSERETTVKSSKTTVACWDESFHWNNVELAAAAWNVGVLEFELQAANAFWRNSTLGMCTLQLRLVCATRDGCYVGRLPLTAPNSVRVIGQLSVTVNVCDSLRLGDGPAASPVPEAQLAEPTASVRAALQVPPLMSPSVYKSGMVESTGETYKYYHLYINVYTLEHVEVGLLGSAPSVTVEYGGCRLQSGKPVRSRCTASNDDGSGGGLSGLISGFLSGGGGERSNFTFNQCFLLPIRTTMGKAILEDNIVVRVWMGVELSAGTQLADRPVLSPRLLAEGVFSLAKLRERRQAPRWFNFYENAADPRRQGNQADGFTNVARMAAVGTKPAKSTIPAMSANRNWNKSNSIGSNSTVDTFTDGVPGVAPDHSDAWYRSPDREGHYIGRILMSASVKRLAKPSDVLVAHVQSSHPLEFPVANPTRLFGDAYYIESRATFGFDGDFEVMLEVCCGPYGTRSAWLPAQRRACAAGAYAEELGLLVTGSNLEPDRKQTTSSAGWRVTLNSINGRLAPIDLLASYAPEEQWLVFVRVHARGLVAGRHRSCVIGSSSFPFENIAEHSTKSPSIPFWAPLSCPGSTSTLPTGDASSIFDPIALIDSVASMDPAQLLDQAAALDPTGLIGTAVNEARALQSPNIENDPPDIQNDGATSMGLGLNKTGRPSQHNPDKRLVTTKRSSKEGISLDGDKKLTNPTTGAISNSKTKASQATLKGKSDSRSSTDAAKSAASVGGPTPGDMCDPGATVNVLLTLHRHSLYSNVSGRSGPGRDIRTESRPRMVSMLKQDYELRCYVHCARLATVPHSGVAVMLACDSRVARTQVQRNFTRFPVFAECCTIPVTAPTLTSSRLAPPPPITVSLLFFDRRCRLLRMESAVTVFNRLVKSAAGHAAATPTAPTPAWLQLSGGSAVLFFSELVVAGEAPKAPKYQMSPLTTRCTLSLGVIGLRQLSLPADFHLDGLCLKLAAPSYGANVHYEQSHEREQPVGQSRWERGGMLNVDLFTVQEASFHIPLDPLLDPHVEFFCYAMSRGQRGPLLGYQSFRCHAASPPPGAESGSYMLDLRQVLNPRRMVRILSELALRSCNGVISMQDCDPQHGGARLLCGVPPVLCDFEASREYVRLLRSMDLEHIGAHAPPRFVVACDGREATEGSTAAPLGATKALLDNILQDIPFSVAAISLMAPPRTSTLSTTAHASQKPSSVLMKYFLTLHHVREDVVHRSYPEALAPVATSASKMLRVFRGKLRNSMHKLRFCVVSANNLLPDSDGLGSLFLVVEIGGTESREALVCEHGSIFRSVNRTWEQEVFLPEDSLIRLRVVSAFERLDGGLEDEVLASAEIDLENRWYSRAWQRMLRKDAVPVERVLLRDPNLNVHGSLDVVVQLGPVELLSTLKPLRFAKSTPSVTEVRVVVWSTSGVRLPATPADSRAKDQLDLYVVSALDCQGYRGDCPLEQKTDTHYNCDSGAAQFNWRLVYPQIHSPVGACQLQLSVFDFWKVGPPVFVGEVTLELRQYIAVVSDSSTRVELSAELPLVHSASPRPVGVLRVTVQVMTQSESSCSPAGLGREHPNCKPFLPTPSAGRQWQDWFAHTSLGLNFGFLSVYVSLYITVLSTRAGQRSRLCVATAVALLHQLRLPCRTDVARLEGVELPELVFAILSLAVAGAVVEGHEI
ncbi:heat shock protein DNAJ pfj4, putative [Babesia caballi]|uniref:Heat shock protein DNAJ pfj4, putative n=1 Tax=Babesia caballi TaxID=5871 RepID=A0AAV4LXC9_BABCB|nr:heat shock protein DNAJ pfj4, putative [Babesia caballi]